MAHHSTAAVRSDAAAPSGALQTFVPNANSATGVTTMVVDANAFIEGIDLSGLPYQLCTIQEVVKEVRDPQARAKLESLPIPLKFLDPSPESLSKVTEFARATGDYQVLSATDLKVIALAHTLEVQAHGSEHIRTQPPPLIRTSTVQRQGDPPGWGSNVPNLEEWDELPEGDGDDTPGTESRILGVKSLQENAVEEEEADEEDAEEVELKQKQFAEARNKRNAKKREDKAKRLLEQKLMVSYGVDASKGEHAENDEWVQAGCRSTRRKHMRRAAQAAAAAAAPPEPKEQQVPEEQQVAPAEGADKNITEDGSSSEADDNVEDEIDASQEEFQSLDLNKENGVIGSDQNLALSTSSVACMTSDFGMQNVILQMGLRLFTPNGVQVKQLQRWMLRCQACGNVTREVGRIFCPKCGNGGTLYRVSTLTGANGTVLSGPARRVSIRGTRYTLPLPKGGREGNLLNPILREDQLARKHRKNKKAETPGLDMINSFDDVFTTQDKRGQESAALRNTIAVLSGRKNPNDQHFTKRKV